MRRRVGLLLACVWSLYSTPRGWAQQESFQSLSKAAAASYQAKDYPAFLTLEKRALARAPGEPRTTYNVACGEALTGHAAAAVQVLNQLLASGLDIAADKDPDFSGIVQTPEWNQFKERLEAARQPMVRSTTAFTLPDKGLIATSIAVDERMGDTYIGSVRERKIVKRKKDGTLSDFATEKDGLLAVTYLLLDPIRRQLIVSMAALPFIQGLRREDEGSSGICIFDLATGKLVRSALLPGGSGVHHLLNSAVVNRDGNLFVVDSGTHELYRLRRASSELELYVSSVVFRAPQGLTLSADERTLYVSDLIDGIWAMEVLSTDRRHIDAAPDVYLMGLDGITRVEDGFIAVQVGIKPNRVLKIRLDAKRERVAGVETLESNHPAYFGPTQGVVSGGDFLYIANSQLGLANPKTGTFDDAQVKPTTILRLPLGK
jgi:sugar lactone lactonase YvrE